MSNISKRRREGSRSKIKSVGDHKEFLNRITKTLYYGELPTLPCLSLPVTEISCAAWSLAARGRSVRRLRADAAAQIARQACVSPCALVLALLYLERLRACNPRYLAAAPPQDLFLVSLMVGNKFLQDDGEDDEVVCAEWAASGGLGLAHLKHLELEFLNAIEWNVFVSDKSFEAGLARLERQVAERQASARGFYTYCDLAAACGGEAAHAAAVLARAAAAATAALALAYLAAVLALLAAAHVAQLAARAAAPAPPAPPALANATLEPWARPVAGADPLAAAARLHCCAEWARRLPGREPARRDEPAWWARAAAWQWASRAALANPVRRWLDRLAELRGGAARDRPPRRRWPLVPAPCEYSLVR